MPTLVTAGHQAGHRDILACARCRHRLREVVESGVWRTYQCTPGCRLKPVDAGWLDDQVRHALAGKIRLEHAHLAVEAITVADPNPAGVRLHWRRRFPAGPQPATTTPPLTRFVPVSTRSCP